MLWSLKSLQGSWDNREHAQGSFGHHMAVISNSAASRLLEALQGRRAGWDQWESSGMGGVQAEGGRRWCCLAADCQMFVGLGSVYDVILSKSQGCLFYFAIAVIIL